MFNKILIANRGEIAVRILRACQELGIPAVTVYSEADVQAPHVLQAEESYLIGPPPVAQSYLNMNKILAVARESGADALHPGYGLLSENPEFARACGQAGLNFIGPSPEAMVKMGEKTMARALMEQAGVPVVPGTETLTGLTEARIAAETIGYPVMVKAAAGGGGIGMQVVNNPEELENAVQTCQSRATAYFGNGSVYLEKFLEEPRHIEVQILADDQGNIIHLNERECSIQRRHQKVIEEAPSPLLDEEMRCRMGEVAIRAAKAIDYTNAGTVEFLVDKHRNFYFLEMNTRLQVEHPVTEMITGVDLVIEQIKIAAGEPLIINTLPPKGHSVECRIYAEDPVTFFPAPGTIGVLELPLGPNLRIDCGVSAGYTVSPYYDPMVAKVITWGEDRQQAMEAMVAALDKCKFNGIKTNIPVLKEILLHPRFREGAITTGFISENIIKGG
ncbi:MAG: acetyl-CoA carboxylase biotin carboxylase subunit [Thermincolia bacterium]